MRNKQNLHIHSTWSDGNNTPRELIEEAIKRGFASIGFTEHSYMYFAPEARHLTMERTAEYKAHIRQLKEEYRGKIGVFCGLEFELYSQVPLEGFDYLIGSLHALEFGGNILRFDKKLEPTLAYLQENFGGNGMAFAEKYFDTLVHLPEKGNFDILGHFDILTKNNEKGGFLDTTDPKYIRMGMEAIHTLKGKIPLFEVNTGAIARGYRTSPYPQMEFLKEFRACGFGAVISSDCHNKDFLDIHFEESRLLLQEAGFNTRWILTDEGFKEVEL